jgi:putative transposase
MSWLLDDPNDPRWQEAERRDTFVRGLLKANGWKATRTVVDAVRMEFGIGRSTVYRMIGRFRSTRKASSLIPSSRGTPSGARRVDGKTEQLIAQQIDRFWLKKERPSMRALIQRVHDACRIEGLPLPHRSTIQRRIDELDVLGVAKRRGETALEAATTPSVGSFAAERPNEVWQIDHTIVDLIVVDEETRLPIGRPVLTIAIDICTRMVAGFHLSLDAPSSTAVGLCLLHAVYDKTAWLQERGIDCPWPVAGLPSILHCDNGAEFHSKALKGACREYGIKLAYRPPATPRFGGHIERLIGTMMGAVHILPGTTFSNTKIRDGYASEKNATFTLRELERWLALEIAGVYQRRIHSALLRPPLAVWQERQGAVSFDLPPDRMAFWTSFLPETKRRLLKDGIHLEKIRYWSDALARDLGRGHEMLVKYDPRDLARIFVRRPEGHYVEARYRNLAFPAITIWEWRNAKRRLFDQGKRDLDEEAIFSALALQRRIEDDAAATSAAARRKVVNRPRAAQRENAPAPLSGIDTSKQHDEVDDLEFWE